MPVPEGWVQVIHGPRPTSVQWPRAAKGNPSNNVSLEPHIRAVGASRTFRVARGSHRCRRQGSGRRTPKRVSKLEAALRVVGEDDDTAPNLREALKRARQQAVPLSIPDKVAQCESYLERARKREAVSRELLLRAQAELTRLSAEVAEGEQRLATLRAELERPQTPVVTVDMSAEVQRLRVLVEQLSKRRNMFVPKPTRTPNVCVVGKISSHIAKRRCKSGSKADRGICKRPSWPAISQKWRGSPNSCLQQHKSGSGSSKINHLRCHRQWRTW